MVPSIRRSIALTVLLLAHPLWSAPAQKQIHKARILRQNHSQGALEQRMSFTGPRKEEEEEASPGEFPPVSPEGSAPLPVEVVVILPRTEERSLPGPESSGPSRYLLDVSVWQRKKGKGCRQRQRLRSSDPSSESGKRMTEEEQTATGANFSKVVVNNDEAFLLARIL